MKRRELKTIRGMNTKYMRQIVDSYVDPGTGTSYAQTEVGTCYHDQFDEIRKELWRRDDKQNRKRQAREERERDSLYKTCVMCKEEFERNEINFYKRADSNNFRSWCKSCTKTFERYKNEKASCPF